MTKKSHPIINTLMYIFIICIALLMYPLITLAQSSDEPVSDENFNNILSNFPEEAQAKQMAESLNNGPYRGTAAIAKVEEATDGTFNVIVDVKMADTNSIVGGCTLTASPPVVRKGQAVDLSWQPTEDAIDCTPGEATCGELQEQEFQGQPVGGNSITVFPTTSDIYMFEADVVTDLAGSKDAPQELTQYVICTREVVVTNWFRWALWSWFDVSPRGSLWAAIRS